MDCSIYSNYRLIYKLDGVHCLIHSWDRPPVDIHDNSDIGDGRSLTRNPCALAAKRSLALRSSLVYVAVWGREYMLGSN